MAKGQKRSSREPKKPKKAVSQKLKGGAASGMASALTHPPGATTKHHSRKA